MGMKRGKSVCCWSNSCGDCREIQPCVHKRCFLLTWCIFLSSLNPKTKPTLWNKSDLWYEDLWIEQQQQKRISWPLSVVANHATKLWDLPSTTNWSPETQEAPHLPSRSSPGPCTQAPVCRPLSTSPGVSGWKPKQARYSHLVLRVPKVQFISCRKEAISFGVLHIRYITPPIILWSIKCFQLRRAWCYKDLMYGR